MRMCLKFTWLLICLSLIYAQNEDLSVIIDQRVEDITEKSTCDIHRWSDKLKNSCQCCLLRKVPLLKSGKTTANAIVKKCIQEGYCTEAIIRELIKDTLAIDAAQPLVFDIKTEQIFLEFLLKLYDRAVIVKNITLPKQYRIDKEGKFTDANDIKQLLTIAYKQEKLTHPDFASIECIKTKNIRSKVGGSSVRQMFEITSQCSNPPGKKYILKDSGHGKRESFRLAKGMIMKEFNDFSIEHLKPGYPVMVFPVGFLSYVYKDKKHILILMPKAAGEPLSKFTPSLGERPTKEFLRKTGDAYRRVGYATGQFHKHFMDSDKGKKSLITVRHADLHPGNILLNEHVYLIDTEDIPVRYYDRDNAVLDIHKLLFHSVEKNLSPLVLSQQRQDWFYTITKNFLDGYLDAFTADARKNVFDGIYKVFSKDKRFLLLPGMAKAFNDIKKTI